MKECIKYIGLDVQKSTIAVAIAEAGSSEVRYHGEIQNAIFTAAAKASPAAHYPARGQASS